MQIILYICMIILNMKAMTMRFANPIYDSVFKYLMQDNRVAKILISALLKKEVLELELRTHEYAHPDELPDRVQVTIYRLDFSARVRNNDGTVNQVVIELQKTWLETETLRFRRYLGLQYLEPQNVKENGDGIPIVSIYILGHKLGDLTEPVIYVRRRYLDYDEHIIESEHPFIESLTHDSIIVLVPYLQSRFRNHVEQLFSFFIQPHGENKPHYLSVTEEHIARFTEEEHLVFNRLLAAGGSEDVRRSMDIEDEILHELEMRESKSLLEKAVFEKTIEEKDKELQQSKQVIGEKDKELRQSKEAIGEKELEIEKKDQEIALLKRKLGLL